MKIREILNDKVFTISNLLSLTRVFLVPFAGYCLYLEERTGLEKYKYYCLCILALMILTDFFDGFIARLLDQVSTLGMFLDPIADKVTIISTTFLLHIFKGFPLWIIVLLIIRDSYSIIGGIILFSKIDIQVLPNIFGKLMVCSVGLAGVIYLLSPSFNFYGVSLQEISVFLIIFFLVVSSVFYWKTYSRDYFENKS